MLARFAEPSEWTEVLDYVSRCAAKKCFIEDDVSKRYAYERPEAQNE